ncbi:MAG: hypothetical protein R3270_11935 [Gammaproteobacteria bacterium]|nr:hypothetical protein [Gammaproteobacteria bacterium]
MKTLQLLTAATILLLLTACASFGAGPFTTADEPHATLEAVINADVTDSLFPGLLVKVDGKGVPSSPQRRTYHLPPGDYVLSLVPDRDGIQQFENNYGRNYQLPRIFFERNIRVTLEEGKRYKFGVIIKRYNYSDWQPYVQEIKD